MTAAFVHIVHTTTAINQSIELIDTTTVKLSTKLAGSVQDTTISSYFGTLQSEVAIEDC